MGIGSWFRRLVDGRPLEPQESGVPGALSIALPDPDADRALLSLVDLSTEQHEALSAATEILRHGRLPARGQPSPPELGPTGEGYVYGLCGASARNGALAEVLVAYYEAGGRLSLSGDGAHTDLRVILDVVHLSARLSSGRVDSRVLALGVALRAASADPRMVAAQELVDRKRTWGAVHELCLELQLRRPLSWLVVCDLASEGSVVEAPRAKRRIARLQEDLPEGFVSPAEGGPERAWVLALLDARTAELERSPHPDAPRLLARARGLRQLAREKRWDLRRPFELLGARVP